MYSSRSTGRTSDPPPGGSTKQVVTPDCSAAILPLMQVRIDHLLDQPTLDLIRKEAVRRGVSPTELLHLALRSQSGGS